MEYHAGLQTGFRQPDPISVYSVIVFHKPDKIRDSLAFIAAVRDQHGDFSGNRISVPVISRDQL